MEEPSYYAQEDAMASQELANMEEAELQQAESMGEIPPEVAPEMELSAEQGFTPEEMTTLEGQQETLASLPPEESQSVEQSIIADEEQSSEYEEQSGLQEADQFDQNLLDS
jgi:hypothetical protein